MNAEHYVVEIFVPPNHNGKHLALYEPLYQCCRSSTSKCLAASLGCVLGFAGEVYQTRVRRLVTSLRDGGLSLSSMHEEGQLVIKRRQNDIGPVIS